MAEPRNSPEATASFTGVEPELVRKAARLYGSAANGAIYYGLGVTEHSQGSTMVMAIANLAMATGNLGREGVGVNPLRGQNNVQGSCDMGSFPHEFSGYRHVSDAGVRGMFEDAWGVPLLSEPGLRIPNMFEAALDGSFKGLYIQGEDPAQSDPDTQHVTAALASMECIVIQDLFLNETAKYAHVFLPGSSFLEKDGTFINAERRCSRVRKIMEPRGGFQDWEVTVLLSNALGYPMQYRHASEIMDEIARLTPTFAGISYEKLDRLGSIQWPCNDQAPDGTPTMHVGEFVRGKGKFFVTEYVPTEERATRRYPLLLTTGRKLAHYNVGAQTRRTSNVDMGVGRRRRNPPARCGGSRDSGRRPRWPHQPIGRDRAAGRSDGPGAARCRVHHLSFPGNRRQRRDHRELRLGNQLPRIQGDGRGDREGQSPLGLAAAQQGVHRPADLASQGASDDARLTRGRV